MDSESIDYKALYEQISGELEKLKLDMWASRQRPALQRFTSALYHALLSRFADMTVVEMIAVAVILSVGIHYHFWIKELKHE